MQRLACISIYQTDYGVHDCETAVWEEFSFLCDCYLKNEETRLCTVANTFSTDCHDTSAVTGAQWSPTWWPSSSERVCTRIQSTKKGKPSMVPRRTYGPTWMVALRFDLDDSAVPFWRSSDGHGNVSLFLYKIFPGRQAGQAGRNRKSVY